MNINKPIPEQLLREFEPQESWLAHDSYYHGVGHMTRVLILQELISDQQEAQGVDINREALRRASMAHDVGRLDDGADPEHGTRSAEWIRDKFADRMPPATLDVAADQPSLKKTIAARQTEVQLGGESFRRLPDRYRKV